MNLKNIRKLLFVLLIILIFMRLFIKEYQYSDDSTIGFALMKIPSVQQTITDQYYGKPMEVYVVEKFLVDENGTIGDGAFNFITSFYIIIIMLLLYILMLKPSKKRISDFNISNQRMEFRK